MASTIPAADLKVGDTFQMGAATQTHVAVSVEQTRNAYTGPAITITTATGKTVEVAWNAFITRTTDRPIPADHIITSEHLAGKRTCAGCGEGIVWNGETWRPIATRNDGAVMMGVPFCDGPQTHTPR